MHERKSLTASVEFAEQLNRLKALSPMIAQRVNLMPIISGYPVESVRGYKATVTTAEYGWFLAIGNTAKAAVDLIIEELRNQSIIFDCTSCQRIVDHEPDDDGMCDACVASRGAVLEKYLEE